MTSKNLYVIPGAVLTAALLLVSVASAQSVYTAPSGTQYSVPAGYTTTSNYGTYYNPTTGMYYDPTTGMVSNTAPTGPDTTNSSGAYVMPAGYYTSVYGTFYNPSTGMYYDPATGITSTTAPAGPSSVPATTVTTTPGLPNTGAGGNADANIAILAVTAVIALGGAAVLANKRKTA